ncbi:MAG: cytidine deaminase [Flavobacteriaceae bacterium]|nr:cytidine deaminase [Flavobacteriaceae bacterium]
MHKKEVRFEYLEFSDIYECSETVQKLFNKAVEAMEKAYAPYSGFMVGAALQLDNGQVITGNNQENAAYPSGLCAERVAVFAAKSLYPDAQILHLVIVTSAQNIMRPVSPCGSCRQVLAEYEQLQQKPFKIYLQSANGGLICVEAATDLLPFNFDSELLNT